VKAAGKLFKPVQKIGTVATGYKRHVMDISKIIKHFEKDDKAYI
jgi:hypothetical protein